MLKSVIQGIREEGRKNSAWSSSSPVSRTRLDAAEKLLSVQLTDSAVSSQMAVELAMLWGRYRAEIEGPQREAVLLGLQVRVDGLLSRYPGQRPALKWLMTDPRGASWSWEQAEASQPGQQDS